MFTWLMILSLGAAPGVDHELVELQAAIKVKDWQQTVRWAQALEQRAAGLAPVELRDMQILMQPPEGLGLYHPLVQGTVRGDEIYLYAQVANHTVRPLPGDWYEVHLTSDLYLFDSEGQELARDVGLGESRLVARTPHRDTFVVIALKVKGLPTGEYRVRLAVHDVATKREASAEQRFKMP